MGRGDSVAVDPRMEDHGLWDDEAKGISSNATNGKV